MEHLFCSFSSAGQVDRYSAIKGTAMKKNFFGCSEPNWLTGGILANSCILLPIDFVQFLRFFDLDPSTLPNKKRILTPQSSLRAFVVPVISPKTNRRSQRSLRNTGGSVITRESSEAGYLSIGSGTGELSPSLLRWISSSAVGIHTNYIQMTFWFRL